MSNKTTKYRTVGIIKFTKIETQAFLIQVLTNDLSKPSHRKALGINKIMQFVSLLYVILRLYLAIRQGIFLT